MCRFCEAKRPYGITPLAQVDLLPDVQLEADIEYMTYGRYMIEIYAHFFKGDVKVKTAFEANYCPKCGRPLFVKHKK